MPPKSVSAELLLTSFGPFRSRFKNGSKTVSDTIQAMANPHIEVMNFPVHWGVIEEVALPRIHTLQPKIILGLGEGPPDKIYFETRAVNRREGEDEKGMRSATHMIDSKGTETISSRWPTPVESIPQQHTAIQLSRDAGYYLCNNALYRYLQSSALYAGFLHLPPQEETSDQSYLANILAPVLSLIQSALDQFER